MTCLALINNIYRLINLIFSVIYLAFFFEFRKIKDFKSYFHRERELESKRLKNNF
jgi:hypothetical protein